jgi:Ca2+-binding RTX toxin-like protein
MAGSIWVAPVAIGAIVLSLALSPTSASATGERTEDGVLCTIVGTAGPDTLRGTSKADVICGLGGADTIDGGPGRDIIDGGEGDDTLVGGPGDDVISGGSGNDRLDGSAGNDDLQGREGDDTIIGAAGFDTISGDDGIDSIQGGNGRDVIAGGAGNDVIDGGGGADNIDGGTGDDRVSGGPGNDEIRGGPGADVIGGGGGDDVIYGDEPEGSPLEGLATSDTRIGALADLDDQEAAADDVIDAGPGNDYVEGGAGEDTIIGGDGDDGIIGGPGADSINGDGGTPGDVEVNVCDPTGEDEDAHILDCGFDRQGPQLRAVSIDLNQIDTSDTAVTVTLRMRVVDNLMGAAHPGCGLFTNNGHFQNDTRFDVRGETTLTSGTIRDGVWSCRAEFPRLAPAGTYFMSANASNDLAGNFGGSCTSSPDGTFCFDNDIVITVPTVLQSGPGDSDFPLVIAVQTDVAQVDTSSSDRTVTFTVDVSDAGSGLRPSAPVFCNLEGPLDPRNEEGRSDRITGARSEEAVRTQGDESSATFECEVVLPHRTPPGAWLVAVYVIDAIGNQTLVRGRENGTFEAVTGSPSQLPTGRAFINQTGAGDMTPPVFSGTPVLSPSQINTSEGPEVVTVTFDVEDDSPITQTNCGFSGPVSGFTGEGVFLASNAGVETWTCDVTFPAGAADGQYTLFLIVRSAFYVSWAETEITLTNGATPG